MVKIPRKSQSNTKQGRESAKITAAEIPLFFSMPDARFGEFCQWYRCKFTVSKSLISHLVEQPLVDLDNFDPKRRVTTTL